MEDWMYAAIGAGVVVGTAYLGLQIAHKLTWGNFHKKMENHYEDVDAYFEKSESVGSLTTLHYDQGVQKYCTMSGVAVETSIVGEDMLVVRPMFKEQRAEMLEKIVGRLDVHGRKKGANAISFISQERTVHRDTVYGVLYHQIDRSLRFEHAA